MYNTDLPNRAELPTTKALLRSTLVAALIAAGLLTTVILPAEYGIDVTGIGRTLGLTQMGEIKTALAKEASQENTNKTPMTQAINSSIEESSTLSPSLTIENKQDQMSIILKPGQGAEVKLSMKKGDTVEYEWVTNGGPVNFDTHGDPINPPKDFYHGYGKGRNQTQQKGKIQAAFDGQHGWFWRNRSNNDVEITLKTDGKYIEIKRVI